jgi:hypothetical protein
MPLQIRRGTETERLAMTQKLAAGEPLWITTTSKLYIGDGTTATPTLLPVTGFTASDAQDAAASLFTTATHTGISFAYDTIADTLTATINLSNYNGVVKGDLKGSVFADDSTLLVDGNAGSIPASVVQGTFTGTVVGNVTGNVTGNVIGNVTGNTNGYHTGDVKGSVFADNSSILVDSVDRIFYGTIDTGDTVINTDSLTGNNFNIGTTTSLLNTLTLNINDDLKIRAQMSSATNGKFVSLDLSRGTLASPTAAIAGDELGGVIVKAYTSSSVSAFAGTFGFQVDPTAVISGGSFIKTKAIISAASDTSADVGDALVLNSAGVVTSNAFVASKYTQLAVYANDAARTSAIPTPAKGMMVLMTAGTSPAVTNKVVAYDGTNWVALH